MQHTVVSFTILLVWNKMYQNPSTPTSVSNPFLEVWAILLLFVQQLIHSLRVILNGRMKLKIKLSKPDKWTHKAAFRGFGWLRQVTLLCSFDISGRKVGKRKIKYGKGTVPKVLLLLLVLYTPSLPPPSPALRIQNHRKFWVGRDP